MCCGILRVFHLLYFHKKRSGSNGATLYVSAILKHAGPVNNVGVELYLNVFPVKNLLMFVCAFLQPQGLNSISDDEYPPDIKNPLLLSKAGIFPLTNG